jgi:hypothetical protein
VKERLECGASQKDFTQSAQRAQRSEGEEKEFHGAQGRTELRNRFH